MDDPRYSAKRIGNCYRPVYFALTASCDNFAQIANDFSKGISIQCAIKHVITAFAM